jgi:flagellar biosynthesis GTPase FlhF
MTTYFLLVMLVALAIFGSCGEQGGKVAVKEGEKLLEKTRTTRFAATVGKKAADRKIDIEALRENSEALKKAAEQIEKSKSELANEEENKATDVMQDLRAQADLEKELADESRAEEELKEDIESNDSLSERCKTAIKEQISDVPKSLFCTYLKSYAKNGQSPSDEEITKAVIKLNPDCFFERNGAIARGLKNSRLWQKQKKFFDDINRAPNARKAFEIGIVNLACQ